MHESNRKVVGIKETFFFHRDMTVVHGGMSRPAGPSTGYYVANSICNSNRIQIEHKSNLHTAKSIRQKHKGTKCG